MDKNTVLSYSPDEKALVVRHRVLRDAGMKVISVLTPAEARFEIEMGRCGNLLICYRLSTEQAGDITRLYRRYCPAGRIVFVTDGATRPRVPPEVDSSVLESSGPGPILQALRAA
jgi:hypothetical protein